MLLTTVSSTIETFINFYQQVNIVGSVLKDYNRNTLAEHSNTKTFTRSLALHCVPAASRTVQQHINEVIVQQVHLSQPQA